MAIAVILNFAKDEILLGYGNPCVGSIYQCTKFDENIFIYDLDITQKSKIQDGGRRHLEFCQRWNAELR